MMQTTKYYCNFYYSHRYYGNNNNKKKKKKKTYSKRIADERDDVDVTFNPAKDAQILVNEQNGPPLPHCCRDVNA
jgi:hypothetical protein